MVIVLFFSKGIMGDRELSWKRIGAFFKDPFGLKRKKKLAAEAEVSGNG